MSPIIETYLIEIYLMKYPKLKDLRIFKNNADSNDKRLDNNWHIIEKEIFPQLNSNPITVKNYDMINFSGIIFRRIRPSGWGELVYNIVQGRHFLDMVMTIVAEIYTLDSALGSDNEEIKNLKFTFLWMLTDNYLPGKGYNKMIRTYVLAALLRMKEKETNEKTLSVINQFYDKLTK